MAKTIGSVEYIVDLDGRRVPAQARKIGQEAGLAAGDGFEKPFNDAFEGSFTKLGKELAVDMKKNGDLSGNNFTDSMSSVINRRKSELSADLAEIFGNKGGIDKFREQTGSVDETLVKLRSDLKELNSAGGLSDQMWNRLGGTLNRWAGQARIVETEQTRLKEATEKSRVEVERQTVVSKKAADELKKLEAALKKGTKANGGFTKSVNDSGSAPGWGNLSTNAKQIILIIAAIASSGGEIAVLGSAIGSASLAAAGGLTALVGGVGVIALAFSSAKKEMDTYGKYADLLAKKNTEGLSKTEAATLKSLKTQIDAFPPYFASIHEIGNAFTGTKKVIQDSFFTPLSGALGEFAKALPQLSPAIGTFATDVGTALGGLLSQISSPEGIKGFSDLIGGLGPVFKELVRAIGGFGGAIGELLIQSLPAATKFAGKIADIGEAFFAWTKSEKGRKAIETFLQHGSDIAGPFLDLIGASAKVLAELVTPETVKNTQNFLSNLAEFMPSLGNILGALAKLDIFGVLAKYLNELGEALTPVFDVLGSLFGIINVSLNTFLPIFVGILNLLLLPLKLLAPLFEAISEGISQVSDKTNPLFEAFQQLSEAFGDVATKIGEALVPVIKDLFDKIIAHMPDIQKFADVITTQWIPAIEDAAPKIAKLVADLLDFGLGLIDVGLKLAPFVLALFKFGGNAITALRPLFDFLSETNRLLSSVFGKSANDIPSAGHDTGGRGKNRFANGGILTRPDYRLAGEAGPEAYIPLTGPLSAVDPSVRNLAAYARGLQPSSSTSNSRTISIAPGAIQLISPAVDEGVLASQLLDRIVALAS